MGSDTRRGFFTSAQTQCALVGELLSESSPLTERLHYSHLGMNAHRLSLVFQGKKHPTGV